MAKQRIYLLDEITINQIAAGEVIENPASVVKELVENALDSGSRSVSIVTVGGGRGLIRVTDEGCGMGSEDLILCLERHATSKLSDFEDLNSLCTMGFRGEALPSIAAVSKLLIHSAPDGEEGRLLSAEGGRILNVQLKPRRQGTTVEVKSLFFNVPVRKKFQKSVGWDTAEIHKVLTGVVLCHPGVAFSWISEGTQLFNISADASGKERMDALLGEVFSQGMLPVEHHVETFHLRGFCSKPTFHRSNKTGQYLFINQRPVQSLLVSQSILDGYGTRLSNHRYPLFVLHLTVPPSLIDVNVHPQKKEIRLREEGALASFLTNAIERAFISKSAPIVSKSPVMALPSFMVAESPILYQTKDKEAEQELFSFKRHIIARVGKYLLIEDPEGIRVVDGGAARVRVAYEQLMQKKQKSSSQHLLIPLLFEVSGAEKMRLLENQQVLEEMGFSIRPFGDSSFIIDAIPQIFESEEILPFVHAFLEEGSTKEKRAAAALRKTVGRLALAGAAGLVEALFQCAEPAFAPDGSPTHFLLTEKEFAKLFK